MNEAFYDSDADAQDRDRNGTDQSDRARGDNRFKKLKRPAHAAKRSGAPQRLSGLHRRRRKRIDW